MEKSKIIAFAKENGYDGVKPLGKWREFDAYEPTFDGKEDDLACVGPPLMILVAGEKIRMSTIEEAYQQIDESGDDDE